MPIIEVKLYDKRVTEESVPKIIEALSPVPLDHVPDKSLDLVLGPDGGAQHVER